MKEKFIYSKVQKTPAILRISVLIEVLSLISFGILAILLHAKLRIPLRLPGHHGLEFMALLVIGRHISHFSCASSISSIGVALLVFFPILGFKDPIVVTSFIIPGIAVDVLYKYFKRTEIKLFIVAIGGIAYMLIPVTRILFYSSIGHHNNILVSGFLYQIIGHFIFGCMGAFLGLSIIKMNKKLNKRERS